MSRILALDYGLSRIGLALSDPLRIIASPLGFIENRGTSYIIEEIKKIIAEHEVDELVIGIPYTLSGGSSEQTEQVKQFLETLKGHFDLPIHTIDERFSSIEAQRILHQQGYKTGKRKGEVDALSATVILETYLMKGQSG